MVFSKKAAVTENPSKVTESVLCANFTIKKCILTRFFDIKLLTAEQKLFKMPCFNRFSSIAFKIAHWCKKLLIGSIYLFYLLYLRFVFSS